MNDFFKNEKELVANAGRAYTKLQGYNSEQSLWTLLLQASDECAVPACGGSRYNLYFYSGGFCRDEFFHFGIHPACLPHLYSHHFSEFHKLIHESCL